MVSIKELGGSFRVQPFWDHYFGNKNGLLFVVNSNDSDIELKTARDTLKVIFSDARLKNKPCLILGTHSDIDGSKSSEEIEKHFQNIMNGRKWCVICCSSFDRKQTIAALETLIDLMIMS